MHKAVSSICWLCIHCSVSLLLMPRAVWLKWYAVFQMQVRLTMQQVLPMHDAYA